MSDLLKRRYVYRTEIELQNALVEAHAEIERLKRAVAYQNKYIEELETVRGARHEIKRLRAALDQFKGLPPGEYVHTGDMTSSIVISKEALGDD